MGWLFGSSKPKDKEIKKLEALIDELEDACEFEHGEDREDAIYELHKAEKKLEALKKKR